jgi:hypothetical protein
VMARAESESERNWEWLRAKRDEMKGGWM